MGTLRGPTDQSSCKTNLTLTNSLTHLLPPPCHQTSGFLPPSTAALINHPKQSMFNLWHAGLTRKFITCCGEKLHVSPWVKPLFTFGRPAKSGETKCATKKADDANVFQWNPWNKGLLSLTVLWYFLRVMMCSHDFLNCTWQKISGFFLSTFVQHEYWITFQGLWLHSRSMPAVTYDAYVNLRACHNYDCGLRFLEFSMNQY